MGFRKSSSSVRHSTATPWRFSWSPRSGRGASACRLSLRSAQASLLKPHAGPAVADVTRVEENNAGTIESFLNCGECARTRIGPTPLQVFNSDLREARRISQLCLRPVEQPAGSAYLSGYDHPDTIDEPTRNSNYRLPYVSLCLYSAKP